MSSSFEGRSDWAVQSKARLLEVEAIRTKAISIEKKWIDLASQAYEKSAASARLAQGLKEKAERAKRITEVLTEAMATL